MRLVAILTALIAAAASFVAVLAIRSAGTPTAHGSPHAKPHLTHPTHPAPKARKTPKTSATPKAVSRHVTLGIINYDLPYFERQTRIVPAITAKYYNWGAPFPGSEVLTDHGLGVTTLIVLEPRTQNMKQLAAGAYDAYLKQWAAADRALGLPIILSFAPEANGDWYPWGKGHISPALYKKIFRHVHDALLRDGARHVTWLWQVDRTSAYTAPLNSLWPGHGYVDAIGFDGQLKSKTATFDSVFGPTLDQVRAFTKVPVMLSEVGVKGGPLQPKKAAGLFAAARKAPLSALVFFDVGVWDFDNNAATIEAIRTAAAARK